MLKQSLEQITKGRMRMTVITRARNNNFTFSLYPTHQPSQKDSPYNNFTRLCTFEIAHYTFNRVEMQCLYFSTSTCISNQNKMMCIYFLSVADVIITICS